MKIIKYLVLSLIITSFSYAQQSGWSLIFRPPDQSATVIDFVDSLHGWVETFGGMRRTTDGGNTWSQTLSENIERLNRISFIDRKNGWAIGSNPTNPYAGIYFSNDSGKTLKPFYYKQGIQLPCG
ncbi:MAG: hypothetical protein Q8933_20260, partial [Bacteroidota bacterium]|nr:hypothetical protein [Bacteroidota bacterium]